MKKSRSEHLGYEYDPSVVSKQEVEWFALRHVPAWRLASALFVAHNQRCLHHMQRIRHTAWWQERYNERSGNA